MNPAVLPAAAPFEALMNGQQVALFYLQRGPLSAAFTNYGARLVSLLVPGEDGVVRDVVLGLDSLMAYQEAAPAFFGSTVGRYANRIAQARFTLDGTTYQLAANLPPHHLHGGVDNFQEKVWHAVQPDAATVVFTYTSPDGEEGYPGNLQVKATYMLTEAHELKVTFEATTDKATVVNLTNHAYFNLNGQGSGDVLGHTLQIYADHITETDALSVPTGALMPVAGTPFDFRTPQAIGARIAGDHPLIQFGCGYDHNFVLRKKTEGSLDSAALVTGEESGISMEVQTTEPGMQLYTANFLKGTVRLRSGALDERNSGFCLETQHFPDAPNHPQFPSTRLDPGAVWHSETVFRFSW